LSSDFDRDLLLFQVTFLAGLQGIGEIRTFFTAEVPDDVVCTYSKIEFVSWELASPFF
jgi:hypothetical protein